MRRRILLLSLLSLLQFVLVHFFLIQHFPNSGDEQAYLFQARLFSRGQIDVKDPIYDRAHPLNKFVHADALDDMGGRRLPKYDPGWAAALAPFARLKLEWLLAPLLGALTVFLLLSHVSKRIGNEFVGITWWLVTLCSFFSLSVANFGNHTLTMALLFGAFLVYDTIREHPMEQSLGRLFGVGLLLASCSLVRYLDWIPLMAWIAFDLLRKRKIKGLVLVLLGFGLLASLHLVYNKLATGNALLPPAVHDARGYQGVEAKGASLGLSWNGFKVTAIRLLRTLYAFPPVILLLLCLIRPCRSARLRTYVALFALSVSTYFLYAWTPAGPGPRYLFPYFPFLFLAVVEVYRMSRDQKLARIGWPLVIAALVICSFLYAVGQTLEIYRRKDLERTVATVAETKRIILLETGTYKMDIPDLIRNPVDLWSAQTVYLAYGDGVGLTELLSRFPEHSVYVYRYPGSLEPWKR
ncbi:MAG: hypothetical protein DLM73_10490 [Chthoniobacterales bacterium]|nr:MAG: hypothetical protein DLM73_10490 [Chthoniobacterales bacterium]